MLKIYNTLTNKKHLFKSTNKNVVNIYVCGPTVYDLMHIGNFRGAIFFNLVRNYLESLGFRVNYIYNYTDIDDKIIKKSIQENKTTKEISNFYINQFEKDYALLEIKPPTKTPKATDYIDKMIVLIEKLLNQNVAYITNTGDVLFSVEKFKDYGKLSGKDLKFLEQGRREIDVRVKKNNPLDFVLWKMAKKGEPFWSSPWGNGRPGWHIECSTMSLELASGVVDIHGGGIDLIFPHHENEIAQSEGATGKTFVKYWMHNNLINFKSEKMSKSLGNIITLRSFVQKYHPEIFKYIVLSSHYRSQITLSDTYILNAVSGLSRIYSSISNAQDIILTNSEDAKPSNNFLEVIEHEHKNSLDALNDDFNTPLFFSTIFNVVREFNKYYTSEISINEKIFIASKFLHFIKEKSKIINLFNITPANVFLKNLDDIFLRSKNLKREDIDKLVLERTKARKEKNYAKSDHLREELKKLSIELHDTADGTYWEVSKKDEVPT